MAGFKTHISFGILFAVIAAIVGYSLHLLNIIQGIVTFALAVIGSVLPDIDSDNARPTQILFGILGIVIPVLLIQNLPDEHFKTEELFCILLFSFLFVQHILSWAFFRFTRHRGIYHSIPSAVIFGELIYLIFHNSPPYARLFFAVAATSGYMVHLVLDEVYSVDLLGARLKKSAGTAVCFRSESLYATILAYILLLLLLIPCFRGWYWY